jgi:hypothetical protein
LKIDSPLSWNTISETSDLFAGHQMGAELLFAKLKTKKFRNKLTKKQLKQLIALKTKKAEPQKEQFNLMILLKWIFV